MSHSRTQSPSYTWSTDHDKGLGVREWVARLIAPHLLQLQIKMSCLCVCYFKTSACVIYQFNTEYRSAFMQLLQQARAQ
jgi:hypothetical protein